ncbi:MAG: HEAT repeat domain-containing protein [Planctomycetes bacterium]|nr:HEAT repeat domain-containing protein [Planctomycetota bacterium]
MRALALLLVLLLPAAPALAQAPGPDAADDALQLARSGRLADAERLLRARLEAARDDGRARQLLAEVLDFDGRRDDAAAVLEGEGAGVDALLAAAHLRRRQASDGPDVTHRRGQMSFRRTQDAAAAAAWKRARLERARDALTRALALEPDLPDAAVSLAEVHLELGAPASALEVLEAQRARRATGPVLARLGFVLQAAGREEEAVAALEQALELDPRAGEVHEALAKAREAQGQADAAARHRRQAAFYAWLPPFARVEFDDATHATMTRLSGEGVTPAVIDEVAEDASSATTGLLAAFVWHHPHSAAEDRAFELLGGRADAVEALRALLDGGQSACTKRGAVHGLARLGAPGTLEVLVRLLPRDVAPTWNLDVAGALAALGDPGAVPHLARLVTAAPPPGGDKEDFSASFQRVGLVAARSRAALALGHFPGEAAAAALERGLGDPELALSCRAALYRQTRAPEHLEALLAALRASDRQAGLVIADLEAHEDPALREALAAWKQAQREAQRRR